MADEVIVSLRADISDIQKDLNTIRGQMSGISNQAEQTGKKTESAIGGAMKSIGPQILAAFSVQALIGFGKQVVDITGRFQKLEAVLINTLGSRGLAQNALKQIQDFAAKTNFSVEELTTAYVKLANQGFKPTTDQLRKLADVANSTGKSFDQLTEAIIDAQTGEFERLKEFGIRAQKEGDNVKFTFKGVETQTKFTNEAIREYILSLGDLNGVSGSTVAISNTLEGQLSNLGDTYDKLLLTIGNAGAGGVSSAILALDGIIKNFTSTIDEGGFALLKYLNPLTTIYDLFIKDPNADDRSELIKTTEGYTEAVKKQVDAVQSLSKTQKEYVDGAIAVSSRYRTTVIRSLEEELKLTTDPERQQYLKDQILFLQVNLPRAIDIYVEKNKNNIEAYKKTEEVVKKKTEAQKKEKSVIEELIREVDKLTEAEEKRERLLSRKLKAATPEEGRRVQDEINAALTGGLQPLSTDGIDERANDLFADQDESAKRAEELRKERNNEIIDSAQSLTSTLGDLDAQIRAQKIEGIEQGLNAELEALNEEYKAKQKAGGDKLKLEEEYQDRVKELNDRANAQIRAERIKQFNIDKALAIANITIDTAQGIAKVIATGGPTAPFLIPIIAGLGATQLAIVSSQQAPKYEKGGLVKGRRHSFGGVLAELEGGEYIAPIHATSKYLPELEAMRNNSFERLKEREWIQPALKKARDEYDLKLYKALHVNASLNDQNLIISDMKTRDAIYELIAVTKQNNKQANWRFRNV